MDAGARIGKIRSANQGMIQIFGSEGKRYIRITLCCPAELLEKAANAVKERFH